MASHFAPSVSFNHIAREWRCKWTEDDDKASLVRCQEILDGVKGELEALDGFVELTRTICGGCHDFKIAVKLSTAGHDKWSAAKYAPEESVLAKLTAVAGVSDVETQTFTLETQSSAGGAKRGAEAEAKKEGEPPAKKAAVVAEGPNPAGVQVGDTAVWERKVLKEHVDQYAEITGDMNPLHFDEAFAKGSRFKELITHGGIQSGALNALVAMKLPGPGSVFLKQELDYTKPVKVGDTLTARGAVTWAHATKPVCHMDVSVTSQGPEEGAEANEVLKGKVVVYRSQPKA